MQRRRIDGLAGMVMVACLLAAPAHAEDEDEDELVFAQSGLYLSAAANFMIPTKKSDIEDEAEKSLGGGANISADADNAWGANGRIGYRLNPQLAVELQAEFVSNIEVDMKVSGVETSTEDIGFFALTTNAKYFLLTGRIQPYVVAGLGWGRSRVKPANGGSTERNDGWVARGGVGVALYGTRDVALTLETSYVHPASGRIEDLDYLSFNAGFTLFFYGEDY